MTEFSYVVPGKPRTWQRDNFVRGQFLTDETVKQGKRAHRLYALAALGPRRAAWDTAGAFEVHVVGYWADARVGDADRLVGIAMDALEGLAYVKDRQVRHQSGRVIADGSPERVEVVVRRLESDPVKPKARVRKRKAAAS